MCENSRTAGIVQKTRRQLRALGLEHPSHWKTNHEPALQSFAAENRPSHGTRLISEQREHEWTS